MGDNECVIRDVLGRSNALRDSNRIAADAAESQIAMEPAFPARWPQEKKPIRGRSDRLSAELGRSPRIVRP